MRSMTRHTLTCAAVFAILALMRSEPGAVPAGPPDRSWGVHAGFDLEAPNTGPFPSDRFTVDDPSHNTGRRVNMPLPDCSVRLSDCEALDIINTLDGFNLQPRLSIPFDGEIDVKTVTSETVFLIRLGSTLRRDDDGDHDDDDGDHRLRAIGINQVVWDVATTTLHVESDNLLDQHTRYALIVTTGIRDASHARIKAPDSFRAFRQTVRGPYKRALLEAIHAARHLGVGEDEIAAASVFTTQSVTAVLEKIRDQIKAATPAPADFVIGLNGERTVFPLSEVTAITFNQQLRVSGPLQPYSVLPSSLSLLNVIPGAVGAVAFGKYESPDYEIHAGPEPGAGGEFIPPVSTRSGTPLVQGTNTIYFNLFLPSGPKPPGGWPVALHGTGADGSKHRDVWVVATLARQGIATIVVNAVSRGFGPNGTVRVDRTGGPSVTLPAGGRGSDQNGDGVIGSQEGQNATGPQTIIGNRDAQRQTVVDYMQLVRVIEVGMDVDGDGDEVPDLDPSRITYFGWSFGANWGTTFLAVEPKVLVGALYALGGPIFENARLSPLSRSGGLGSALLNLSTSLLNSPGISVLGGVNVSSALTPPPLFFNENMPLRDGLPLDVGLTDGTPYTIQSPVMNTVPGANAIQDYIEKRDWVNQAGNQVAYARYLRRAPLAGVRPKSVLILFGKGDQTLANPNTTALLRAGDLADRATYYRNDLANGESLGVPKNPHPFVNNITHPDPVAAAVAWGAQTQIALFLASRGTVIVQPEPKRFFEVPIRGRLPESLNFIQ
jgi:hypothetical protein